MSRGGRASSPFSGRGTADAGVRRFPALLDSDERLRKNLSALRVSHPRLAASVATASTKGVRVFLRPDGAWTGELDGVPLHSPRGPTAEVEADLGRLKCAPYEGVVLYGTALGEGLREILGESRRPVFVYEPELRLLRILLGRLDLSNALLGGRLVLTSDLSEITGFMAAHVSRSRGGVRIPILPMAYHATVRRWELQAFMQEVYDLGQFWASFHVVRRLVSQELSNATQLARLGPASLLRGCHTGGGCLIVGAGPSLDLSYSALRTAARRALVIAADAALKPLLEQGVRPDLVLSDEGQIDVSFFYEGLPIPRRTSVVSALHVSPRVFGVRHGEKLVYLSVRSPLAAVLESHGQSAGALQNGASVTCAAVSLAQLMGCKTFVLVGQDHAPSRTHSHARGCRVSWPVDPSIFEGRNPPLGRARGLRGGEVVSTPQLCMSLRWLERFGRANSRSLRLFNGSGGGALIRGFETIELRESLRFLQGRPAKHWRRGPRSPQVGPPTALGLSCWLEEAASSVEAGRGKIELMRAGLSAGLRIGGRNASDLRVGRTLHDLGRFFRSNPVIDRAVAGRAHLKHVRETSRFCSASQVSSEIQSEKLRGFMDILVQTCVWLPAELRGAGRTLAEEARGRVGR
ncbi:MAG: DUF115 domain-containing protein [Nitrospirae bacterium]|nr:DUF115 domain-containing protein [Nitrospirota bacterium]